MSTTDSELMLHYGRTVRLVPGTAENFKITTPLDLAVAEMILTRRALSADSQTPAGEQWREALRSDQGARDMAKGER